MKKIIGLIIGMALITIPAWAGELEEAKLKMRNIELEFQLLQTRSQVLQFEAQELQVKIKALEAQKKDEKAK